MGTECIPAVPRTTYYSRKETQHNIKLTLNSPTCQKHITVVPGSKIYGATLRVVEMI